MQVLPCPSPSSCVAVSVSPVIFSCYGGHPTFLQCPQWSFGVWKNMAGKEGEKEYQKVNNKAKQQWLQPKSKPKSKNQTKIQKPKPRQSNEENRRGGETTKKERKYSKKKKIRRKRKPPQNKARLNRTGSLGCAEKTWVQKEKTVHICVGVCVCGGGRSVEAAELSTAGL